MTEHQALSYALNNWREIIFSTSETGEARLRLFKDAAGDAAKFIARGVDRVEIADKLEELAVQVGNGLDDVDARQQIIVAAIQAAVNASAFRQTSSQFVAAFVPPDYLIDGILIRRFIYSFTGKTGSGKTSVTLLWAACVALARNIGDLEVARGTVFYFCGENPEDVRMRWIAQAQEMGFDPDTIDVHFYPKRFKISEEYDQLVADAQAVGGVALVVVDTSQAYFEGDDFNNNRQQLEHVVRLRTLIDLPGGPTVVVNSHPVKNAAPDNLVPYGGGAFLNEVDGNLTCAIDGVTVEVGWQGKFRGPDLAPIAFRLRSGVTHPKLKDSRGRPLPTVVAEYLSESAQQEIANAARSHEDQLLAEIEKDGHASVAEYARRCGWFLSTGKPYTTLVFRTLKSLEKHKLITKERKGYALTEKGRKELSKDNKDKQQQLEQKIEDRGGAISTKPFSAVRGQKYGRGVPCAQCHVADGNVYKIKDGRQRRGHSEALHERCAEDFFTGKPAPAEPAPNTAPDNKDIPF